MDKLDTALAQIVDQLQKLAAQHGSEAVSLMGTVLQMQAARKLLEFIPDLAFLAIAAWAFSKFFPWLRANWDPENGEMPFVGALLGTIVSGVTLLLFIIGSLADLGHIFDPVIWYSAFDPRIAIAAHVLKLL